MNNNRNEIFSDEKLIEKELKKHPERNRVKIDAMAEVMVLMAGFWR